MIAPLRETEQEPASPSLRAARRLVASTLLKEDADRGDVTPVAGWQAWLFVAWMGVVILAYGAHLLGWL